MKNLKLSIPEEPKGKLPKLCGWNLLIQPIKVETSTTSGLVMTEDSTFQFEHLLSLGKVLQKGPLAYKEERLGTKHWCEEGDIVIFSKNGGFRYSINGNEFIVLNDDRIMMVVDKDTLESMDFEVNISHKVTTTLKK